MEQNRKNQPSDDAGFDTRIVIRCTAANKALAFAHAQEGGYSDLSAFGRHLLCGQKPKRRSRARQVSLPDVQVLSVLVRELQGQGNNLNQIAKQLNAGRTPSAARIEDALHLHEHALMSILEAFGNT